MSQILGQIVTIESSTDIHTLGEKYVHPTSGKEYIYCQADEALTIYDGVVILPDFGCVQLTKTDADKGYRIGITNVAVTANYYFWAQIVGATSINAAANCVKEVPLYTSGTAGQIDDAGSSQTLIDGLALSATTGGAAAATACVLSNPVAVQAVVEASEVGLAEGNVLVGNSSGVATALNAKATTKILVGNATTITSVPLSGDVTMDNAGAVTIGTDKVTNAMVQETVVKYATITVTNTQVKGLATSQKELVAAPGSDKVIELLGGVIELVYGGNNGFTESGDNLVVKYTNASGVAVSEVIETTGFIDQTAHTMTNIIPVKDAIVASSAAQNQALVLDNNNSNFGGNAGNDNTLTIKIAYRVHDLS